MVNWTSEIAELYACRWQLVASENAFWTTAFILILLIVRLYNRRLECVNLVNGITSNNDHREVHVAFYPHNRAILARGTNRFPGHFICHGQCCARSRTSAHSYSGWRPAAAVAAVIADYGAFVVATDAKYADWQTDT